jgi:hypothetical protein
MVKKDNIVYDDIIKNLKESESTLIKVREELKLAKTKSIDISLEFCDNKSNIDIIKLDTLNNNIKNTREILNDNVNIDNQNNIISSDIDKIDSNIQKIKSNHLFNFE